MAKVKVRPVVHTHENAKVEFYVKRESGDFPTLIDVSEFYSVCQETADAFCTAAEAEEVMEIVLQALADTRPVESVPVGRCKDCKWFSFRQDPFSQYCEHHAGLLLATKETFCSLWKEKAMDGGKHEKGDKI